MGHLYLSSDLFILFYFGDLLVGWKLATKF